VAPDLGRCAAVASVLEDLKTAVAALEPVGAALEPDAFDVAQAKRACMSYWNHLRSMRPELLNHLRTTAAAEGIEASLLPIDDMLELFAGWPL
jgi:hypothetical protein